MNKELRTKIREKYKEFFKKTSDSQDYFSPYEILDEDILNLMTPIEYNVWHDIRSLGIPFYFQFPVKQYFIDFADPIKKIGIEVDSKMWHKDKNKDEIRQRNLEKLGWEIIRIEGKNTYKDLEYYIEKYGEKSEQ